MDGFIVTGWLLNIGLYILVQHFFLQKVPRDRAIVWQRKIMILFGVMSFIISLLAARVLFHGFFADCLLAFINSLLLLATIAIYLLSIYSYIESSITVRIFSLIGERKQKEITMEKLEQLYNVERIVTRRLDRFVAINEVSFDGVRYTKVQKISEFVIRDYIHAFVHVFFS